MRNILIALAIVLTPRAAFACPVCFGQSDSPMALGTNMAVFFMLGVTAAVLVAFASFFVYLMRRANLVADVEARVACNGPATAGPRVTAGLTATEEGTARC